MKTNHINQFHEKIFFEYFVQNWKIYKHKNEMYHINQIPWNWFIILISPSKPGVLFLFLVTLSLTTCFPVCSTAYDVLKKRAVTTYITAITTDLFTSNCMYQNCTCTACSRASTTTTKYSFTEFSDENERFSREGNSSKSLERPVCMYIWLYVLRRHGGAA